MTLCYERMVVMSIWVLQTITGGGEIAGYCLKNNVVAMGWSINDAHIADRVDEDKCDEVKQKRKFLESYEDYKALVEEYNIYVNKKGNVDISNIKRLCKDFTYDDLVWMRYEGKYYLGRCTNESKWIYNCEEEALEKDVANQVTAIDWFKVGDESEVPGAIISSLIAKQTFHRCWADGVDVISKMLYNKEKGYEHYKNLVVDKSKDTFYTALSPTNCEDLLCMWLYVNKGYVCIPSTNKISTELYECVLVNPVDGKRIYPQVKNSIEDLDATRYKKLDGEVWLFTTKGKVVHGEDCTCVNVAKPEVLFEFAMSDVAKNVLPTTILKWVELFK